MKCFVEHGSSIAVIAGLVALLPACNSASSDDSNGAGAGAGGSGGSGGSGGGGPGAVIETPLPVPPGSDDLPRPEGAAENLQVIPWAGFSAAVSYTLDDSQPSQIEHWPELRDAGVRMTFYINSSGKGQAGYVATWQEAMAEGHEIGNHTVNHCHADLSGCTANAGTVEKEIDDCTAYIETELGQADVWTFAFPFGDAGFQQYSPARFFLARGVNSGTIGAGDSSNPFNLPVVAAAGGESADVFNGRIDTAVTDGRWLIFLFHSILPTSQNWYAGVDIGSITGSIEHAEELGSVWIDTVANVGAYWLGQRALEAAAPTIADDGATTWTWSLPSGFPGGRKLRVSTDGGTLTQGGEALTWDGHGYYEVALDAGSLTLSP